jgi:hypothetical protein
LITLYAALTQSVQVIFDGIEAEGFMAIDMISERDKLPTKLWKFVNVCVRQLVLPLSMPKIRNANKHSCLHTLSSTQFCER